MCRLLTRFTELRETSFLSALCPGWCCPRPLSLAADPAGPFSSFPTLEWHLWPMAGVAKARRASLSSSIVLNKPGMEGKGFYRKCLAAVRQMERYIVWIIRNIEIDKWVFCLQKNCIVVSVCILRHVSCLGKYFLCRKLIIIINFRNLQPQPWANIQDKPIAAE